ncbi:MAG: VRR-NUC domain-containing protein [Sinobacteraceae bacterium]|nr:VRR-NUC domain-containing protein [Nevskiaceae bacterium]
MADPLALQAPQPPPPVGRPFYYLDNFRTALHSLQQRYGDLLSDAERGFLTTFSRLPPLSAALLVRMIGRKGDLFRSSRLRYAEIGCPHAAAEPLMQVGWLQADPLLSPEELGRLLRRAELAAVVASPGCMQLRKDELLRTLMLQRSAARTWSKWWCATDEQVYRLCVQQLSQALRLIFFGNFRQTWAEYVLTDLGIFRYETLPGDAMTRAFQSRAQIEIFLQMYRCQQQLEAGDDPQVLLAMLPEPLSADDWLEARRGKLEFEIAQRCERLGLLEQAITLYRRCPYSGARVRLARVLERAQRFAEALQITEAHCERAHCERAHGEQPPREFERQQLARIGLRLRRRSGAPAAPPSPAPLWPRLRLSLPCTERPARLEQSCADLLARADAPVFYVESRLLNSLFGLLFWDAIFAPLPGAFFHEFQAAPADLFASNFASRRATQIAHCFAHLESTGYREIIEHHYHARQDVQSPFVCWGLLSEALLDLALECIAPDHLRLYFTRLLQDLQMNHTGLPDLIQLVPGTRSYRLIEVKGPGDRLQDNQRRWLHFCVAHALPAQVLHVGWQGRAAAGRAAVADAGGVEHLGAL